MAEIVDHEARRSAESALQQIELHVKHCDEAAQRQTIAQATQLSSIVRLHGRMDKLLWSLFIGMGALLAGIGGILLRLLAVPPV